MKKSIPTELPEFRNDEEIAAFMEKYDGFDLVDAGLAEIVPTPLFVRGREGGKTLLKNKRVQVAFKDERSLRKTFSPFISSTRIFLVIDTDLSGILLSLPDSPAVGRFYVPYLNISGIKILDGSKKTALRKSTQRMAQNHAAQNDHL